MTTTSERPIGEVIAELRELHVKATPVEWWAVDDDPEEGECSSVWKVGCDHMLAEIPGVGFGGNAPAYANAALIAAMRNALPRLLDLAECAVTMGTHLAHAREMIAGFEVGGRVSFGDCSPEVKRRLQEGEQAKAEAARLREALEQIALWERTPWVDMADEPEQQERDSAHALRMACRRARAALEPAPEGS